jgi:hypothetical protein
MILDTRYWKRAQKFVESFVSSIQYLVSSI